MPKNKLLDFFVNVVYKLGYETNYKVVLRFVSRSFPVAFLFSPFLLLSSHREFFLSEIVVGVGGSLLFFARNTSDCRIGAGDEEDVGKIVANGLGERHNKKSPPCGWTGRRRNE